MQGSTLSKQPKQSQKFPWKLALPSYLLSYFFMLLFLKAYFWDDWYLYFTLSDAGTKKFLDEYGFLPLHGIFEVDVLNSRPELFRLITIVGFFLSGWFIFHILKTVKFLKAEQVKLITVLFLVLPINSARVAMTTTIYTSSFLFFFFAWYLLITKRLLVVRALSIPLFLLSFSTLSFITFFAVPCVHFLYMNLSDVNPKKKKAYLSTAFLAMLSPVYWVVSRHLNPPLGARLEYQTPTLLGIARGLLILIICAIFVLWYLKLRKDNVSVDSRYAIILAGVSLTALGAFPYVASGRLVDVSEWLLNFVPRASDWDSRHQLLLGLGLAITLAGIIGPFDSTFKRRSVTVFIGLCVALNMTYMHAYYLDALKQDQIISAIHDSDALRQSRVIMINDTTDRFNARGRHYRSYEWDGILTKALGDSSRSIVYMGYVNCNDPLTPVPDTILTIIARNGRFESTLTRNVGIELFVEPIQPCG